MTLPPPPVPASGQDMAALLPAQHWGSRFHRRHGGHTCNPDRSGSSSSSKGGAGLKDGIIRGGERCYHRAAPLEEESGGIIGRHHQRRRAVVS